MSKYYVYLLNCNDNTLYTGYTTNLENRIEIHNQGKGSKYTRARLPVSYAFTYECKDLSHALKLEYRIKRLKRKDKLKLIENPSKIEKLNNLIKDIEN